MTDLREVLGAMRREHEQNPIALLPADDPNRDYYNSDDMCLECAQDWPCDASRALDTLAAVLDLADDWEGEAEGIESTFMPGPNSTTAAGALRDHAEDVRAVIANALGANGRGRG